MDTHYIQHSSLTPFDASIVSGSSAWSRLICCVAFPCSFSKTVNMMVNLEKSLNLHAMFLYMKYCRMRYTCAPAPCMNRRHSVKHPHHYTILLVSRIVNSISYFLLFFFLGFYFRHFYAFIIEWDREEGMGDTGEDMQQRIWPLSLRSGLSLYGGRSTGEPH